MCTTLGERRFEKAFCVCVCVGGGVGSIFSAKLCLRFYTSDQTVRKQNLIKIYHVVQELFAFLLTAKGQTDRQTDTQKL